MVLEISALSFFLLGGWLWADSMRAREAALAAGRRACDADGVQFLDWTVAVVKMRIDRAHDGRLRIQRVYEFEFSDTGNNRLKGSITLLGTRLVSLYLSPGDSVTRRVAHLH